MCKLLESCDVQFVHFKHLSFYIRIIQQQMIHKQEWKRVLHPVMQSGLRHFLSIHFARIILRPLQTHIFSGIIRMDRDADESAKPSVKMGGNLHTIIYVRLVQNLSLIFQNIFSFLLTYIPNFQISLLTF